MSASPLDRVRAYWTYHWREKWEFHYLEFPLAATLVTLPHKDPVEVRVATTGDIAALDADLFLRPGFPEPHDRRYVPLIGQPGVRCYLAIRDGVIVHYSWVFLDASRSPLTKVPFDARRIRPGDVYVGPVYTDPSARGFLFLHVLGRIVEELRQVPSAQRVLVLVQGGRAAAVSFYKKMGFQEILRPNRRDLFTRFRGLRRTDT